MKWILLALFISGCGSQVETLKSAGSSAAASVSQTGVTTTPTATDYSALAHAWTSTTESFDLSAVSSSAFPGAITINSTVCNATMMWVAESELEVVGTSVKSYPYINCAGKVGAQATQCAQQQAMASQTAVGICSALDNYYTVVVLGAFLTRCPVGTQASCVSLSR